METTKYVSRHTGEEIDSLLDTVKEDLVEPATLTKQVEKNAVAIGQEVKDRTNLDTTLTAVIKQEAADSEKLDSKSVANMLHLGAYDSYTYDKTTGIYTVTRQTTYNADGTQSQSSSSYTESLPNRYYARQGQTYIEEWKKSEADRSSNLCNTFDRSNIRSDSPLYSATLNPDGSYTSTATRDQRAWGYFNSEFKLDLEPGTYTLSAIITSSDADAGIKLFDSGSHILFSVEGGPIDLHKVFTLTSRTSVGIMVKSYTGSTYIMLNRGSVSLPYQPYEGEVVHGKGLAETLSAYPTSQSVSETYLSKADASSQYRAIDDSYSKSETPLRRYGRVLDQTHTAGTTWGKVADITMPLANADRNISFLVEDNNGRAAVIIGILKLDVRNDNSATSSGITNFSWLVKTDNANYPLSSFVAIKNGLTVSIYVKTSFRWNGITLSELSEYDHNGYSTFGSYALYSAINPTLTDLSTVAGTQTVSTMDVIENTAVSATNATNDDAGNRISTTYLSKADASSTYLSNAVETFDTASSFSAKYPRTTEHLWRIKFNFQNASSIFTRYKLIDVVSLYTADVTNMSSMFDYCSSLTSVPAFNTANVTNMSSMFDYCSSLTSIPVFNTANVTNMSYMFSNCFSLTSVPALNTTNVTNMSAMFGSCASLISVPVLNTTNVTNMRSMFSACFSLISIPAFKTVNVTDMSSMFNNCASLTSVPAFNTAKVTNMQSMFASCFSLTSVPVLNTVKVTDMSYMFYSCRNLTSVPALNTANVTNMTRMFYDCRAITAIHMTGMKTSFDISSSTLFTREALNEIIGNCATVSSATTLTIGATNLAKLTTDDIAVATGKGWTLA